MLEIEKAGTTTSSSPYRDLTPENANAQPPDPAFSTGYGTHPFFKLHAAG
jgi:hypothetical protein